MPLYEYECKQCGRPCELLVFQTREKPQCPSCGSTRLARKFSTFAAHSGSSAAAKCPSGDVCPGQSSCASGRCPFSE